MVITMALKVGHSMYRRLIPGKTMPLHISQHIHDCIEFHKATLTSKKDGHGSSAEQRLAAGKSPWSEPSLHVHVGMQQSSSTYLLASHASHAGRRWSLHVVCLGCCSPNSSLLPGRYYIFKSSLLAPLRERSNLGLDTSRVVVVRPIRGPQAVLFIITWYCYCLDNGDERVSISRRRNTA